MSARSDFEKFKSQTKTKTFEQIDKSQIQEESTSVDTTIEALTQEKPAYDKQKPLHPVSTKPVEPSEKQVEPVQINGNFTLKFKAREARTEHKNFLITKSVNEKLSEMSKQSGVSENEIVNEILKQALIG